MEKIQVLEGLLVKEFYDRLQKKFRESLPFLSIVSKWVTEVIRGRKRVDNDSRSEGQNSATTPEMIQQMRLSYLNATFVL